MSHYTAFAILAIFLSFAFFMQGLDDEMDRQLARMSTPTHSDRARIAEQDRDWLTQLTQNKGE